MLYSDPKLRDIWDPLLSTHQFFRITGGDIVASRGRMVATMQVPLQSHHSEASRLENCCEFLSLYLLRVCS
jgi:hypothetical protein